MDDDTTRYTYDVRITEANGTMEIHLECPSKDIYEGFSIETPAHAWELITYMTRQISDLLNMLRIDESLDFMLNDTCVTKGALTDTICDMYR